jgi:hypothetical protein
MKDEKKDLGGGRASGILSRRAFIRASAAFGASAALSPFARAASASTARAVPGERLAVAMWDFSWLTRRTDPEAEYADFDRVLDDLSERGYNCVRMDAFPHLVAAGPDGSIQERFTMLPQKPAFMWGNHTEVVVEPRAGIIEFMHKCKDRGMRVGLSSWFQPDRSHRVDMVNTPEDFTRVWAETLELIDSHSLLDIVEWVDLCNEFPLKVWAPGAVAYMNEASRKPLPLMFSLYTSDQKGVFSRFMKDSIDPLKRRFPALAYCYSFAEADADALQGVDLSSFDVLEPHLWINMNIPFAVLSGLWITLAGIPKATYGVSISSASCYRAFRGTWLKWLGNAMDRWASLSRGMNLPLYTTEAWGPVNYDDLPPRDDYREWRWVKDIAERAIDMALERGWKGICSSNFCGPQHYGMWTDIEWHRKVTRRILK